MSSKLRAPTMFLVAVHPTTPVCTEKTAGVASHPVRRPGQLISPDNFSVSALDLIN